MHIFADGPATTTVTVDLTDADGAYTDPANAIGDRQQRRPDGHT